MKQIALVDDHYIVRQGLEFLLSTKEDIEVVGSYGNGYDVLTALKTSKLLQSLYLLILSCLR